MGNGATPVSDSNVHRAGLSLLAARASAAMLPSPHQGIVRAGVDLARGGDHQGDPWGERAQRVGTLPAGSGLRGATWVSHCQAVERVILAMRDRPGDLFTLESMAQIALFSLYHFSRIFRLVTGISPHKFLAALRMQAAKNLLLTTGLRVTDICYEVGYSSLGTFTSQFNQQVGMPPSELRRLKDGNNCSSRALRSMAGGPRELAPFLCRVSGEVASRQGMKVSGPTFVGLFSAPLPQGRPAACTVMTEPGMYEITSVPDGRYYVMAATLPWSDDLISYLLPDESSLQVGKSEMPVVLQGARVSGLTDLTLRPMRVTDPPIVSAVPVLLTTNMSTGRSPNGSMTPPDKPSFGLRVP
jgi:AraC family transcriptional regulator